MEACSEAEVGFCDRSGALVAKLRVYSQSNVDGEVIVLSPEESRGFGESQVQLLEGGRYEYELILLGEMGEVWPQASLEVEFGLNDGIIHPSRIPSRRIAGTLLPGLRVGHLPLCVKTGAKVVGRSALEVRSRKLSFREDFRKMVEDITSRCLDLLLELRSPAEFRLLPDPGSSPQTIAQRFSFLRSLLNSRVFQIALQRIVTHPHRSWCAQSYRVNLSRRFRPNASLLRQIARDPRRNSLADTSTGLADLPSIPSTITGHRLEETLDTAENRFIKFGLSVFLAFLGRMRDAIKRDRDSKIKNDITSLMEGLETYLGHELFSEVRDLETLPLGSSVLQRKEGYREFLQVWLQFDMAARLVWTGGEDVYGAGARDVAVLYEYWVFFCLLEAVCKVFKLTSPPADTLLEETDDGFGLKLKRGVRLDFDWQSDHTGRLLKIKFSFNRRFKNRGDSRQPGSWTRGMQPDYTLSIWPGEFSEAAAEAQELISHIHFDAKYRVDSLQQLFGEDTSAGDVSNNEDDFDPGATHPGDVEATFKRSDLLKMHAYKDAIRRTHGAYVIYPGTESGQWKLFHELLPGLGAFTLRPRGNTEALEAFLHDVASHVSDRASARERLSYHVYDIYQSAQRLPAKPERDNFPVWPESEAGVRMPPPSEIDVLVGYCKGPEHLKWVLDNGLYNTRIGRAQGSIPLTPQMGNAQFVFLHGPGTTSLGFFEIRRNGPRIYSREDLLRLGYPTTPSQQFYLVFEIGPADGFQALQWDFRGLVSRPIGRNSSRPFTVTLEELLETAVVRR